MLSTLLNKEGVTVPWQSGHLGVLPADDEAWRVACAANEGTWPRPRLRGAVLRPTARRRVVVEGDAGGVVSSTVCIASIVSRHALSGPSRHPKADHRAVVRTGAFDRREAAVCCSRSAERRQWVATTRSVSMRAQTLGLGSRAHRSRLTTPQASCAR